MDERDAMVQWMNLHWNNSFVNQMQLPLLCEKSGAILLELVGLMGGWQACRQSDEILIILEIYKILHRSHR